MSTSQGSKSKDNRTEISKSLKAGPGGHIAFIEKQDRSMTLAEDIARQRVYMSRSIGSDNVLESEKSAEEKTQGQ